ncbi:MAG: Tn3 family transposase [Rhizobiales bacterium]|nr:Tn3 family transposase [Hyphomicrobiales bacterium]
MPRMTILNSRDRAEFDNTPEFNHYDRKKYFALNNDVRQLLNNIQVPQNKIYFMLMLGYFKYTNKLYTKKFHEKDVKYLCSKLSINDIESPKYHRQMMTRYKKTILKHLNYAPYGKKSEQLLKTDIGIMVRSQVRPKLMFIRCIHLLKKHKFEVPSHHIISRFIIKEMNLHKKELTKSVSWQLTDDLKISLNSLVENNELSKTENYPLTLLKKFHQSTKPMKVKENIADLKLLKDIYDQAEPLYRSLNLNPEGLRFYANYVLKSRVSQIIQKEPDDKYLHLVTFVTHQYFTLQDTLVKSLHQAVKNSVNGALRKHKDQCYENRQHNAGKIKNLVSHTTKSLSKLQTIKTIVENRLATDAEKLNQIKSAIYSVQDSVQDLIDLTPEATDFLNEGSYYDMLEKQSVKLQNRVSEIIQNLDFCELTSAKDILAAADHYKMKDGNINHKAPVILFDSDDQKALYNDEGKFRVSLYKILLFRKISDGLRSGQLNLRHSYQNKALVDYMIESEMWHENRADYIRNAELESFTDCDIVLSDLENILDNQYHITNKNIIAGKNSHIRFNKEKKFTLQTPKVDKEASSPLSDYFPNNQYTHGYNELIFATTHLLDVSFAPRIKNLKKQQIYSFQKKSYYEKLGYKILPKKYINRELIKSHWDDILRFMATIKLKETSASQLFKRLNSYSKQHSLYRALKEFGKIIKSIFILKYIDNLELRQAIEKQLNKVESSNKFSRAISFGNNQEFKQDTKEEQIIAEGCSRIIKNSIICWNYLYLRKQIENEDNPEKKQEIMDAIKNGSVVTWQHINLHGEYDFSDGKLLDSIGLSLTKDFSEMVA